MSYVPIVPQPPPSPRAKELGRRLREAVDAFRRDHPGMDDAEVRQAFDLARPTAGTPKQAAALALLMGVALLAVFAYLLVGRGLAAGRPAILMIVVGVAVVAVAVAAVLRNR